MRLIKLLLKIKNFRDQKYSREFLFLDLKNFELTKNGGGRGDYTRIFIAGTRRCAQFSLGRATLIRPAILARDFLKFFPADSSAQTSLLPRRLI